MSIVEHVSMLYIGLEHIPRTFKAWSHGRFIFSFIRIFCPDFHTAPVCSFSKKEWGVAIFSHPNQYFLLLVFLILGILTGVRWNLKAVLICTSLIVKLENSLRYILSILISFLRSLSSDNEPIFQLGCLFLDFFSSSLNIKSISPLTDKKLAKLLSYCIDFPFTCLIVALAVQKSANFMKSDFLIVGLNVLTNRILFRKSFPIVDSDFTSISWLPRQE